ncbi:hypothetical protein TDB9533_03160 [Thalassocella blandensis]|nr:hypothetical protein TDB9533_03160 [Thalassocella blandensis]
MKNEVITFGWRYGGEDYVEIKDIDDEIDCLIKQLQEEEFEQPDDEHTQAYVARADKMLLTCYVDGLMKLSNSKDKSITPLFHVAQSKHEMKGHIVQFIEKKLSSSEEQGWYQHSSNLPPRPGNDFRSFPSKT